MDGVDSGDVCVQPDWRALSIHPSHPQFLLLTLCHTEYTAQLGSSVLDDWRVKLFWKTSKGDSALSQYESDSLKEIITYIQLVSLQMLINFIS